MQHAARTVSSAPLPPTTPHHHHQQQQQRVPCVSVRVCVRVRVCANRTCHCSQVCVGSVTRRKNQLTLVRALHRAARELNAGAAARADGAAERSG